MTVQQLRTLRRGAEPRRVGESRSGGGAGRPAVDDVGCSNWATSIAELSALESQVAAWRLALAAEADVRRVAEETADTDTTAWLMRLTADPREVAAGGLWLARRLQETYPATREAFAAGSVADRAGPGDREGGRAGPGRGDRRAARGRGGGAGGQGHRGRVPVGSADERETAAAGGPADVRDGLGRAGRPARVGPAERRGRPGRGGDLVHPARQRRRHLCRPVRDPRTARHPAEDGPGPADRPPPPHHRTLDGADWSPIRP